MDWKLIMMYPPDAYEPAKKEVEDEKKALKEGAQEEKRTMYGKGHDPNAEFEAVFRAVKNVAF